MRYAESDSPRYHISGKLQKHTKIPVVARRKSGVERCLIKATIGMITEESRK